MLTGPELLCLLIKVNSNGCLQDKIMSASNFVYSHSEHPVMLISRASSTMWISPGAFNTTNLGAYYVLSVFENVSEQCFECNQPVTRGVCYTWYPQPHCRNTCTLCTTVNILARVQLHDTRYVSLNCAKDRCIIALSRRVGESAAIEKLRVCQLIISSRLAARRVN